MQLSYALLPLTLISLFTAACDNGRRAFDTVDIEISGAYQKRVRGKAEFGYAASISGGKYSFGISWAEDSVAQQAAPPLSANMSETPIFPEFSVRG
jgi:hypothetical protein